MANRDIARPPMTSESGGQAPRRLRRAEAVLSRRMARLTVVIEDLHDSHNIDAVIRTAEAFGLQHLYRVDRGPTAGVSPGVSQGAAQWLTLHRYDDPASCLVDLRRDGYTVWAADVAPGSRPLDELELPPRLAVALGSEHDGLSSTLTEEADARFFIPMVGFTGSLNVSVTAALVIWEMVHRFVDREGTRGDLDDLQKASLRADWYTRLARTRAQQLEFPAWIDDPPEPLYDEEPPPERRSLADSGGDRVP